MVVLSIIVIVISISFICYIKNNNTYQTVEKIMKKGNTLAFLIEQDDGTYQSTDELPSSGYVLNTEKSQCTNGAIPSWDEEENTLKLNFEKKNTICFLYFDIAPEDEASVEEGVE